MSVHDVAAVDRLNSLKVSRSKSLRSSRPHPEPGAVSRDGRPNSDTLRQAMARHQASLSRPESPHSTFNDDIPAPASNLRRVNLPARRNLYSPSGERRSDRLRTVSSTGQRSIPATGSFSRYTPGLQETKAALRSSQEFSDEVNYEAKTLPKMDNLREGSMEDISDLSTKNYPYLSNSTYSLPRNHRLYKSNTKRRYTSNFRESQESFLTNATELSYPESRETLLNRYPSSGRNTPRQSPASSRPSSPKAPPSSQRRSTPSYGLQSSYSTSSFPREYQQPEPSRRAYQGEVRHWQGYHSDYDYRRSVPVSPASSLRSSRAASPHIETTEEYMRGAQLLREISSPPPPLSPLSSRVSSARSSRVSSARSSRASSPRLALAPHDQTVQALLSKSDSKTKIVYVRETFQVVPEDFRHQQLQIPVIGYGSTRRVKILDEDKILDVEENDILCDKPEPAVNVNTKSSMSDKAVMTESEDGASEDDRISVVTQSSVNSSKADKGTHVDLSNAGITNIEEMLESLSRRVRNVEAGDKELVDNDDSARAESVASMVSSVSSKGRDSKQRMEEKKVGDKEAHSVIRRQSVIIEGLTLETEELKRRCQYLEDEIAVSPAEDLQGKLSKMEGKLEETENYCYQVVEENVELKTEIENLESEISEAQDTFRDKDAKEFKKTKWELENLSKTCRNLQLKLGKAQARASRLRQEKEEIEEQQREQRVWKTTAVIAATALAVFHLVNKYK